MLLKTVSFFASIILLFTQSVSAPEKPTVLIETLDNLSENKTADEINGANGTRFYIQRPKSEKLNEINSGFLDNKKIVRTNSISVWAEVNSQLKA